MAQKTIFIALFSLIFGCIQAQNQVKSILNVSADTLINSVYSTNNYDKETELGEIKDFYKLSIWHFAPSLSYDFIRQNYYVSVSTSALVTHFNNKKQARRRIGAIERKYTAKNQADEIKIQNKVLSIEADYQDILLNHKAVSIEIEAYLINKKQYENNEIDTEKFLSAKSSIIGKIKNHNSSVTNLYKNILELSSTCGTSIPADLKPLYFDLQFLD